MPQLPTADDFRVALARHFERATRQGCAYVDIRSGDLHRELGGYPAPAGGHRMPTCCHVMHQAKCAGDEVRSSPPSGLSTSLIIRYKLPRRKN